MGILLHSVQITLKRRAINMVFSLLFPFVCLFLTIGFFERYSNINFYTRIIIQLGFSFSPLYCRNDYPIICQVFNLVPREIVSYELLITFVN